MSKQKKEFTGKDVTDAIKAACEEFGVAQEDLAIEVLEPGSTGIFGLIRKKARISVTFQPEGRAEPADAKDQSAPGGELPKAKPEKDARAEGQAEPPKPKDNRAAGSGGSFDNQPPAQESVLLVQQTLEEFLTKMQFPSSVSAEVRGSEIFCTINGEFEDYLTSHDGRVLDSIQYLLRKMIARKSRERIRLSVDTGNFRERREKELKERALKLAELVRADGKTQVISNLNPSERRVVHMTLQGETEIKSRSVGEGVFKKVLIYKSGKGGRHDGYGYSRHRFGRAR
ncbi:MAG: RNA-binding protein [Deltaproteobacteria bacterium]|nr:MAG: RNA-binding protein [Deltaproteobacteria bacterium]